MGPKTALKRVFDCFKLIEIAQTRKIEWDSWREGEMMVVEAETRDVTCDVTHDTQEQTSSRRGAKDPGV